MKYILLTGGVLSGVGKGVCTSSLGTILQHAGLEVTCIKIDPYLNVDAGTFSPYEHGEVYVLDDGGEVDLDLGNYERFLELNLKRENNITTGKILSQVLIQEREGKFLGATVQVNIHVTTAILEWIERVAHVCVSETGKTPVVCIIELGGTLGDPELQPFTQAFSLLQKKMARSNGFCSIHVCWVPQPKTNAEFKTKPSQNSLRMLRQSGLEADVVICRSENHLPDSTLAKFSNACDIDQNQIISLVDLSTIYEVPIVLHEKGIQDMVFRQLGLGVSHVKGLPCWEELASRVDREGEPVRVTLVGKYSSNDDAYVSVKEALVHAALFINRKVKITIINPEHLEPSHRHTNDVEYMTAWVNLHSCQAIIMPGGFGVRGFEGMLLACRKSRESNKPFLGICLGLQAAVVEFARNILGYHRANSAEMEPQTRHPVVVEMPEHNGRGMGGTMRLGKHITVFNKSFPSKLRQLYGHVDRIEERHRHRYEVNYSYVPALQNAGLLFVGSDLSGKRMEIIELQNHPYYVATQFHPEYKSRPTSPSPAFLGLLLAATNQLEHFLDEQPQTFFSFRAPDETPKVQRRNSFS